jgi:hypothetical protein
MKPIRNLLLVAGISASLLSFGRAQPTPTAPPADDFQTLMQAVEATPPQPATAAPRSGNFYSAQQGGSGPPLPSNFLNLPFWDLGNRAYLLADQNVDYAELQAEADAAAALAAGPSRGFSTMASSRLDSSAAYGNPVYLTNLVVSSSGSQPMGVSFSVAGGTNNVPYDILMSTNAGNPVVSWNWSGIGYTSNRYSFSNQPASQAFTFWRNHQRPWSYRGVMTFTDSVTSRQESRMRCKSRAGLNSAWPC